MDACVRLHASERQACSSSGESAGAHRVEVGCNKPLRPPALLGHMPRHPDKKPECFPRVQLSSLSLAQIASCRSELLMGFCQKSCARCCNRSAGIGGACGCRTSSMSVCLL